MHPQRLGKYEITGRLGKGAMGVVYRGHDPVLGRDVAVKVLTAPRADADAGERFLREARAAAQLNHPNIITVHEFGEEQGQHFMAMELLDGRDLREVIEKREAGSLDDRLAVMAQVLDGVAFAHARGLVHRDLKPGNVRILPSGQAKILDFGLARSSVDAGSDGAIRGTPYYMAPEQVKSERATARSDVFSLGAMFYELLSGRKPFPGSSIPAVLYAVVHEDPVSLGAAENVPAVLSAVISRAIEKDPARRFADAGEMRDALHAAWMPGTAEEEAAATADPEVEVPDIGLGPPLLDRPDTDAELRAALEEVDQYLDDRVPPLFAAEAVVAVARLPPAMAAVHVLDWTRRQLPRLTDVTVAEVLFHALHKLSVVGELNLTDKPQLIAQLRAAGAFVVDACAPPDREPFRAALARLGEADALEAGLLRRKKKAEAPRKTRTTPGLRRMALLEQRLRRDRRAAGPAAEAARRRVAAQALNLAANEAADASELVEHLKRLRAVGVPSGAGQVFRSLGQELPDWALPADALADAAQGTQPSEVRAMMQIVALAEDPAEAGGRYRHLVSAATQLFNEGNLGQAVRMLQLAATLTAEKRVQAAYAEPIVRRGHEALDGAMLRTYMEKPDRYPQLRVVLGFFEPGLGVEALMQQLETEERRDRRRMALDLLVVHAEPARAAARARLLASVQPQPSDFARRNWIYLLRLVARAAGEPVEPEVDALAHFAVPGRPGFLVREAVLCLSQIRHPRAPQALAALLEAWENEAERTAEDPEARAEAHSMLDRLAAALARQGRAGWTTLVEHALARRPELGDTAARLAELASQDLSSTPDVVDELCADIREGLPRGVLGRLVGRGAVDLPALVAALSGTRTPAVKAVLEEVVKRCSGQEAARAATRVLESLAAPPAPAVPGFSGELDRYGLPAVLHRLAREKATGTLQLVAADGGTGPAWIGVSHGRVVGARCGHRKGLDAFHQIVERPLAGTYALEPGEPASTGVLGEIPGLLDEGMRRAGELRRATAVVPEDLPLEPTGQPPGTVDEPDYDLVVALWQKACSGVTAETMEAEMAPDAWRILNPLAQWLEEGSLRPSGPEPPPDPPDPAAEGEDASATASRT